MNLNVMRHSPLLLLLFIVALASCKRKSDVAVVRTAENQQAKAMLQGIWVDSETEEVSFRVKGDTIFFPDSTSRPTSVWWKTPSF